MLALHARLGICAFIMAAVGLAAGVTGAVTPVAATAASPEGLIAHEWGTFTSFSGPDGKVRPFETYVGPGSDLPDYVHTWGREGTRAGTGDLLSDKAVELALHRMETPVIYFYAGVPQTVRVEARVLDGRMTEFYPPVTTKEQVSRERQDRVWWDNVRVEVTKPGERSPTLRNDKPVSHYYQARETESSMVEVQAAGAIHREKFLFYRGLANFESKVVLRAMGNGRFKLTNGTGQKISSAFVVKVEGKQVQFARVGPIGEEAELRLPTEMRGGDELGAELRAALNSDGLFPMEAAAMVNTWKSQWLGEPGTRVLYSIPSAEIDRLVPLTITPTPKEVKRVFVGRMDILTPEDVSKLEAEVKAAPAEATLGNFASLGRFTRAAVQYVESSSSDPAVRTRAGRVLGR